MNRRSYESEKMLYFLIGLVYLSGELDTVIKKCAFPVDLIVAQHSTFGSQNLALTDPEGFRLKSTKVVFF